MLKTDWNEVVGFHGHQCPGLATGYRVALIALREMEQRRAIDEELVAIVENDACGVDAIMYMTGCTLGKGNLIYRDYGKQVYTFVCRQNGKAIRIAVKPQRGSVAEDRQRRIEHILNMPEEEFCTIKEVHIDIPPKARIFNSVICAQCGETVSEARARIKDGKIVCIPCAGEYTRGW
jgi:formylmethanofuran dehydrogenase subunit E